MAERRLDQRIAQAIKLGLCIEHVPIAEGARVYGVHVDNEHYSVLIRDHTMEVTRISNVRLKKKGLEYHTQKFKAKRKKL